MPAASPTTSATAIVAVLPMPSSGRDYTATRSIKGSCPRFETAGPGVSADEASYGRLDRGPGSASHDTEGASTMEGRPSAVPPEFGDLMPSICEGNCVL